MGVSQLLGARARASPKVYAYDWAYKITHCLISWSKTIKDQLIFFLNIHEKTRM